MSSYRFSPIESKDKLVEAVIYTATTSSQMCSDIIGSTLPIHTLTIFSHFDTEFDFLRKTLLDIGSFFNENNGPRVKLYDPIKIGGNVITHLRIRHPDSERPQVGCNDFDVENYEEFRRKYLLKHQKNLVPIQRPDYEMIEFKDPKYDVLAYVISS